jgi:hypothetical protein
MLRNYNGPFEGNTDTMPAVYDRSFFGMSPQGKYGFGAQWHPSRKQARVNAEEMTASLSE